MSAGKSLKDVGTASLLSDHRAGSRRTSLSGLPLPWRHVKWSEGSGYSSSAAIKATEDRVLQHSSGAV